MVSETGGLVHHYPEMDVQIGPKDRSGCKKDRNGHTFQQETYAIANITARSHDNSKVYKYPAASVAVLPE